MKTVFRFARSHKFIAAAILLIGLELAALPAVWWRYAVRDFPFYAFVQDFLVPRMTLGWWIKPRVARGALQEYVGDISMRPSKWAEFFPADIILGWRPAPNKIARDGFNAFYFITNAQGFSVVESLNERYAVPKPANVFRVVVVGGSTVMGAGVPDPRKALPAKLLEELRRAPVLSGGRVEVINAGVAGYDISQKYFYLLTDLVQYEPDLVVAYHGWNDFGLSMRLNSMTMEESPFRKREFPVLAQRLNRSYTVLGNLLHMAANVLVGFGDLWTQSAVGHILRSLGHRIGLDLHFRPDSAPKAKIEDMRFNPRSVEHFIQVMKAMISLGRDRGFKVALMLQPHGYTSPKPYSDFEGEVLLRDGPEHKVRSRSRA